VLDCYILPSSAILSHSAKFYHIIAFCQVLLHFRILPSSTTLLRSAKLCYTPPTNQDFPYPAWKIAISSLTASALAAPPLISLAVTLTTLFLSSY